MVAASKPAAQSSVPKGTTNTLAAPTKTTKADGSPANTKPTSQSVIEPPTRKLEDMPFSEQMALLQKKIEEEVKLDRETQAKIDKLQTDNSDFI